VTSLVRRTDDVEDAYRALSVVLAARKSFDTGQRIYLANGDAKSPVVSTA
jgi:hypothetical protein